MAVSTVLQKQEDTNAVCIWASEIDPRRGTTYRDSRFPFEMCISNHLEAEDVLRMFPTPQFGTS